MDVEFFTNEIHQCTSVWFQIPEWFVSHHQEFGFIPIDDGMQCFQHLEERTIPPKEGVTSMRNHEFFVADEIPIPILNKEHLCVGEEEKRWWAPVLCPICVWFPQAIEDEILVRSLAEKHSNQCQDEDNAMQKKKKNEAFSGHDLLLFSPLLAGQSSSNLTTSERMWVARKWQERTNLLNVEFDIESIKKFQLFRVIAGTKGGTWGGWTAEFEFGEVPLDFRKTTLESSSKWRMKVKQLSPASFYNLLFGNVVPPWTLWGGENIIIKINNGWRKIAKKLIYINWEKGKENIH